MTTSECLCVFMGEGTYSHREMLVISFVIASSVVPCGSSPQRSNRMRIGDAYSCKFLFSVRMLLTVRRFPRFYCHCQLLLLLLSCLDYFYVSDRGLFCSWEEEAVQVKPYISQ